MATLYLHQVYCLHGVTGQTTADVAPGDTTFAVAPAVLADVTIEVGAAVVLTDGANASPQLTITAVDVGAGTITVDHSAGFAFLAATPTDVRRTPHVATRWTETATELTECPELSSHAFQAGSAITADTREPDTITIRQSKANLTRPRIRSVTLDVPAGTSVSRDMVWPYLVTIHSVEGRFEATNPGDTADFLAGPDTPVGLLTAAAPAGTTVFNVAQTVVDNVAPAVEFRLFEGATLDDLGEVIAVDRAALTVTVSTPSANAFTSAAAVVITIVGARGLAAPTAPARVATGEGQFEGRDIQPGMALRAIYHNVGPDPARMIVYARFLT